MGSTARLQPADYECMPLFGRPMDEPPFLAGLIALVSLWFMFLFAAYVPIGRASFSSHVQTLYRRIRLVVC